MSEAESKHPLLNDRLLDSREVEQTTKLSGRTIQRLIARGLMPRPFKVGAQNRWSQRTIEAWMAAGCPAIYGGTSRGPR